MTNFVHCRGCGHQIHETAPACPKCGAPQAVTTQAPLATQASAGSSPGPYGSIPWFRQRWALVCIFLLFAPAAAVIAWSGEIHYLVGTTVKTFPKSVKVGLTIMAAVLLIAIASDDEVFQGLAGFMLIGGAIGLSLRK
uniref:Zinc ribbon domain-containing protein n=1 Tax=Variovorax paradoxus (strain S110) TaxID=543728 RepID=C5CKG2_VARPS